MLLILIKSYWVFTNCIMLIYPNVPLDMKHLLSHPAQVFLSTQQFYLSRTLLIPPLVSLLLLNNYKKSRIKNFLQSLNVSRLRREANYSAKCWCTNPWTFTTLTNKSVNRVSDALKNESPEPAARAPWNSASGVINPKSLCLEVWH